MTKQPITRTTVADFIADRLADSDKTQREIAEECGFEKPNIITMFKNGATKLPINRIGPLAKALNADPAHLLRLVMAEYFPDTWVDIENIMQSTVLSANELELVRAYRQMTGDNDAVPVVINRDAVIAIVAA
ncbi:MAG: XRE family transcriptional regulator [Gammaproteobacteria bacterium]|nr:XRE family transcriptional regulator [Gammaproteobacteria bacterium]MBU1978902.1 XRE family transcriptional regulator [Gammaproteobacteria bacterium]